MKSGIRIIRHMLSDPPVIGQGTTASYEEDIGWVWRKYPAWRNNVDPRSADLSKWDASDWYMLNTKGLKWHGITLAWDRDKKTSTWGDPK